MGQSPSNRRNNQYQNRPFPSPQLSPPFSSQPPPNSFPGSSPPAPAPPLPSSVSGFSSAAAPCYSFPASSPYPAPVCTRPGAYPPTPPPPPHNFYSHYSSSFSNNPSYGPPPHYGHRLNYPYYQSQNHGLPPIRAASSSQEYNAMLPQPLVQHQKATTVRNDVNVHKETIRLQVDETNPGTHLVSFTFDALVDGSINIFYFAKEGNNCTISPLDPEIFKPVKVPFQKGLNQEFHQPLGTGVDLGFFVFEDLAKPTSEDAFPLVISAEAFTSLSDERIGQSLIRNAQITEAIIEIQNDDMLQVKVVKQILWVDGIRYELRELFGIEKPAQAEFDDDGAGKECVICLTEPKDTAVLPCRHLCMCNECAKVLKFQTSKCPICRQPVEQLIEIDIKKG